MEAMMSFMSGEAVRGGRWQAQCCQRHRNVNTPTVNYNCWFTQPDVNHLLSGRRQLLQFSLWSLTCSMQWTAFVTVHKFYYIGDWTCELSKIGPKN